MNTQREDVIIIGGGAAGIAAAKSLAEVCTPLLLEAHDQLGGRIYSPMIDRHRCELGATVGYNPTNLPFAVASTPFIQEAGDMALILEGRIYRGEQPAACLGAAIGLSSPGAIMDALREAMSTTPPDMWNPLLRRGLDALFNVMNPGEIDDYARDQFDFALHRFYPSHHIGGNIELIHDLADGLRIRPHHRVERIVDGADHVRVEGPGFSLRANAVVLATDAVVASQLLDTLGDPRAAGAALVRYGSFVTVAQEVSGRIKDGAPSYCVDADMQTAIATQLHTADPDRLHRLTLFSGALGRSLTTRPDAEILRAVELLWRKFPQPTIGPVRAERIARWPHAGTVVDVDHPARAAHFADQAASHPYVLLAGDYVAAPYYGIQAAIASGVAAASRLIRLRGDLAQD